jgi:hypothetical protein
MNHNSGSRVSRGEAMASEYDLAFFSENRSGFSLHGRFPFDPYPPEEAESPASASPSRFCSRGGAPVIRLA